MIRLGLKAAGLTFLVGISVALNPEHASAASIQFHRDARGMPECLAVPQLLGLRLMFRLDWKRADHYARTVHATIEKELLPGASLDLACASVSFPLRSSFPFAWTRRVRFPVRSSQSTFLGAVLPPSFQRALAQIERGANEYRVENSPAEYWEIHPLAEYTRADNVMLGERFGISFTSSLLRLWLEQQPSNRDFWNRMRVDVAVPMGTSNVAALWSGVRVVIVPGTGVGSVEEAARTGDYSEGLYLRDFRSLGITASGLTTDPLGSVTANSLLVRDQLLPFLRSGEHLIILAESRGMAEAFTALAALHEYSGQISGVLNFSGLVRGSFLAEWAAHMPWVVEASAIANRLPAHLGRFGPLLQAVLSLGYSNIEPLFQSNLPKLQGLPVAINVLAIPPLSGIAEASGCQLMQEQVIRRFMTDYGPNDGLIAPPDSLIPEGIFRTTRTIAVSASHDLYDGDFEGRLDLRQAEGRRAFLTALLMGLRTELTQLEAAGGPVQ